MDEMRQVSRTVVTVVLFLLIIPNGLQAEDYSREADEIDQNVIRSMSHMSDNLEKGIGVSLNETNTISKSFATLGEYIRKKAQKHIQPGSGSSFGIYFEFPNKRKLSQRRSYKTSGK